MTPYLDTKFSLTEMPIKAHPVPLDTTSSVAVLTELFHDICYKEIAHLRHYCKDMIYRDTFIEVGRRKGSSFPLFVSP